MIAFTLSQLARHLDGEVQGDDVTVRTVSIDTRTLQPGDLYVALRGPTFDGHDYLDVAAEQGACAAMVERDLAHRLPRLKVADTRLGLGRMAAAWRRAGHARVVAITGSNGKTTVKEMLAAILGQNASVLATRGNLNNDIGLPLTLTRLQDEDYAVLELGANHAGEIDYLSHIAAPDVALLLNAGRAHLEGFGSVEGVARAKAEIINGLVENGVFVFNADDPHAPLWRELAAGRRQLSFGRGAKADVRSPGPARLGWDAQGFISHFGVETDSGSFEVSLALAGEHNRINALAACAAAIALGVAPEQIQAGLASLRPVPGRLCPVENPLSVRLIDDSYNANPDSVSAAIAVLASAPGRRTLVLGDLAELGEGAAALHAQLGEQARDAGIERLYTCGSLSAAAAKAFGAGAVHFTDREALIRHLAEHVDAGDSVLVKGSRSAAMDNVVRGLTEGLPC